MRTLKHPRVFEKPDFTATPNMRRHLLPSSKAVSIRHVSSRQHPLTTARHVSEKIFYNISSSISLLFGKLSTVRFVGPAPWPTSLNDWDCRELASIATALWLLLLSTRGRQPRVSSLLRFFTRGAYYESVGEGWKGNRCVQFGTVLAWWKGHVYVRERFPLLPTWSVRRPGPLHRSDNVVKSKS